MPQDIRAKLYATLAALGVVLVVVGIVNQAQADEYLNVAERILDLIDAALLFGVSSLAWWKSRPKNVTVIDVPAKDINTVNVGEDNTFYVDNKGNLR